MLSGVALHPGKAQGPVQFPGDGSAGGQGAVGDVDDGVAPLPGVQHPDRIQGALVPGLAAALGEEGGLIQDNVPLSPLDGGAGENLGGEGAAVAVLVVEFGCHSGGVPFLWILFLFLGHDGVFHQQVLDGLVQKTGGGDAGLRG